MMRPFVGFDMDGVILDSDNFAAGDWIVEAFMKTLREFGIPETEENARALYINNLRENAGAFCEKFGISDPRMLWARREEHYVNDKLATLEAGQIDLFPDVAALEELRVDYPLGIASNSPQIVVDRVVSYFSLDRIFRVWIGRGSSLKEICLAKPSPHLLKRLKGALGSRRGYYIGDQLADIQAAQAALLVPIEIVRNGSGGDIRSLTELKRFLAHEEAKQHD